MKATDYPLQKSFDIVFHHIDAMGHLNNVEHLIFVETCRIAFMHTVLGETRIDEVSIILGDQYIRYQSPAFMGERLTVGIGVARFGTKSFDFAFQIDAQDGRPVAQGKNTVVSFDYVAQQAMPTPQTTIDAIVALQAGWELEK